MSPTSIWIGHLRILSCKCITLKNDHWWPFFGIFGIYLIFLHKQNYMCTVLFFIVIIKSVEAAEQTKQLLHIKCGMFLVLRKKYVFCTLFPNTSIHSSQTQRFYIIIMQPFKNILPFSTALAPKKEKSQNIALRILAEIFWQISLVLFQRFLCMEK